MTHGAGSHLTHCPEPQCVSSRGVPPPRGWPSERTALSQHRRRGPGRRRASRSTGVVIPLAAAVVVAAIAGAAYLVGVLRPGARGTSGAVAAVAAVPASHTVALLEKQRAQLIAMSAASKTLSLVGQPKLASRQPTGAPAAPGSPSSA